LAGGLSSALSLLIELPDFVRPADDKVSEFIDSVKYVVETFIDRMPELETINTDAVTAFGNAVGSLFSGLESALTVLQGLVWFVQPAQDRMDNFMNSVKRIFIRFTNFANNQLDPLQFDTTERFGEVMGSLFSGLQEGLTLIEGITDLVVEQSTFNRKLQLFAMLVSDVLSSWQHWIRNELDVQALDLVTSFSGTLSDLATGFNNALTFLTNLNDANLPDLEQLREYMGLIVEMFESFIRDLDEADSTIPEVTNPLRNTLFGAGHGWGVAVNRGIVSGLDYTESEVTGQISNLTELMGEAFRTGLQIASPSRLFADMTHQVPVAIAQELESGRAMVENAMGSLLSEMGGNSNQIGTEIRSRQELHVIISGNGLQGLSPADRNAAISQLARELRVNGVRASIA
jgi:hypothetical protein